jgi:hypothetical protein
MELQTRLVAEALWKGDSSAQESLRNLYKILASDEFFVRTFQNIVQSLKNLVPEHLDSNQRKDFILDALKLSFVRDGMGYLIYS